MLQYEFNCLCSDVIAHNARVFANKTAVVCGDRRLDWQELNRHVNRFANALLGLGLGKGDKVCILSPNSLESFVAFWGIVKAGCVVVPANTMLERHSFARLFNESDSLAIFVDASMRRMVESARADLVNVLDGRLFGFGFDGPGWRSAESLTDAASPDEPKVQIALTDSMTILYSSGTTGEPKGIEHAHYGRLNYSLGFSIALKIDRHSVAICPTPLYASGTWMTMFPAMCNGGTVVLIPKFSADAVLQSIQDEGGTHVFMVPAQYIVLLQADVEKFDASSLQVLLTAGQAMPKSTYDKLRDTFPQARICETYGGTEGYSTVAMPEDRAPGKPGTVGKPSFFDDIRIVDSEGRELGPGQTGEIVAYGVSMMKGYYGRPDLTAAATWAISTKTATSTARDA